MTGKSKSNRRHPMHTLIPRARMELATLNYLSIKQGINHVVQYFFYICPNKKTKGATTRSTIMF